MAESTSKAGTTDPAARVDELRATIRHHADLYYNEALYEQAAENYQLVLGDAKLQSESIIRAADRTLNSRGPTLDPRPRYARTPVKSWRFLSGILRRMRDCLEMAD